VEQGRQRSERADDDDRPVERPEQADPLRQPRVEPGRADEHQRDDDDPEDERDEVEREAEGTRAHDPADTALPVHDRDGVDEQLSALDPDHSASRKPIDTRSKRPPRNTSPTVGRSSWLTLSAVRNCSAYVWTARVTWATASVPSHCST